MAKQRLPRVKREIFGSLTAEMKSDDFLETQVTRMATENPQLLLAVDALNITGGLTVAAFIYALLDSQAEADEMNEDYT